MGVLTWIDGGALAMHCQTWARWRRAEEFIQKHGNVLPIKDKNGRLLGFQKFPHVSMANRLLDILHRQQHELGLTASGRARIQVDVPPLKLSPIMELIADGDAG